MSHPIRLPLENDRNIQKEFEDALDAASDLLAKAAEHVAVAQKLYNDYSNRGEHERLFSQIINNVNDAELNVNYLIRQI